MSENATLRKGRAFAAKSCCACEYIVRCSKKKTFDRPGVA